MEKKKTIFGLFLLIGLFVVGGCLKVPVRPPIGVIYTKYKAPLQFKYNETSMDTEKTGASNTSYLNCLHPYPFPFTVAFDSAAIKAAADKAGIKKIEYVDYEYLSVLWGVYQTVTVIPHGE